MKQNFTKFFSIAHFITGTCLHLGVSTNNLVDDDIMMLSVKFSDEKMRNCAFKRLVQYLDI